MFKRFAEDESGATAIEYGLIVSFLFVAIVASIHLYVDSAQAMFQRIDAAIQGVVSGQ